MGKKARIRREREQKAKKNRRVIIPAVVAGIIAVSIYFGVSGDGEQGGGVQSNVPNAAPIEATWIEPQVAGDTVSIPVSEVEDNWHIHFKLNTLDGNKNFMAYILDGEIYVRANVCPPCGSIGFALENDVLICDTCATTFEAKTGNGIKGACVDFPKASVSYEIADGNILMNRADLIAAYQNTLEAG